MRALVALVALVAAAAPAAAAGAFRFQVPPGWVNVSPDAPPEEVAKAPPEVVANARSFGAVFFAADVAHASGGFLENVNAIVKPGTAPVTDALLTEVAGQIERELKQQGLQAQYRVLDRRVTHIGDVAVGRYVGVLTLNGVEVKQVAYLIPGSDQHAILTYSTTPALFPQHEPMFDTAALATLGAVQPTTFGQRILHSAGRGALIGGLSAAVAVTLLGLLRRRKKPA